MQEGYYIKDITLKKGPFTLEELKNKNITPKTRIYSPKLKKWVYAEELPELKNFFSDNLANTKEQNEVKQQKQHAENQNIEKEKNIDYQEDISKTTKQTSSAEQDKFVTADMQLETKEQPLFDIEEKKKELKMVLLIVLSVIQLLLCCLPLAIISLIYAINVEKALKNYDLETALKNKKVAQTLIIINFVVTLTTYLGIIIWAALES